MKEKARHVSAPGKDKDSFNSGFSRKAREKHLTFQVGLYSSGDSIMVWAVNIII